MGAGRFSNRLLVLMCDGTCSARQGKPQSNSAASKLDKDAKGESKKEAKPKAQVGEGGGMPCICDQPSLSRVFFSRLSLSQPLTEEERAELARLRREREIARKVREREVRFWEAMGKQHTRSHLPLPRYSTPACPRAEAHIRRHAV